MSYNVSENFTLEELWTSKTAILKKIDNRPTEKEQKRLVGLVIKVLQPIRDAWGSPIIVTSGYRCEKLNNAVGGAKNSDHKYGCAVDIKAKNGDNKGLFDLICRLVKEKKIVCRQIIDEYNYSWVHVSYNGGQPNSVKINKILHLK